MKKLFITVALILTLSVVLSSCSTAESLKMSAVWGDSILEQMEYTITYQAPSVESPSKAVFELDAGSYSTTIKGIPAENSNYTYELKTITTAKGRYILNGETYEFSDKTEATVSFYGVSRYSLYPISSVKTVKSTGVVLENGKYSVKTYDIKITADYNFNDKKAEVRVLGKNEETGEYDAQVAQIAQLSNYKSLKTPFFDNEMILFGVRSMVLSNSFSTTFTTIDALMESNANMVAAIAAAGTEEQNFTINGEEGTHSVFKTAIYLNATMSGSEYYAYYAQEENAKRRLYKLESEMPYGLGTLIYTINSVNFQNI